MSWSSTAGFYFQLGTLSRAGMTMAMAIGHAGAAAGGWHRERAPGWAAGCAAGRGLAEQLAADGEQPLAVALVRAGETSGRLPEMCGEVAGFYEHALALRRMLIARLVYPVLLVHVTLVIPGLALAFVGGHSLLWALAGPAALWTAVGALALAWRLASASDLPARLALQPVARSLTLPLVAGNSCLVLRAGLAAGMLFHQALELAAGACGNRIMGGRMRAVAADLAAGRLPNLTAALARLEFPRIVVQLCENGEVSGTLEETLGRAAAHQAESFRERTTWTVRIAAGTIYAAAMLLAVCAIVGMTMRFYVQPLREQLQQMDGD